MNTKVKVGIVGILLIAIIIPLAMSTSVEKAVDNVSGEVAPAIPTSTQGIPGLVCFRYDRYSDTWILSVEQTGPKEFIASGYNPIYPSALTGGGGIYNGRLLLSLDETSYNTYGTGMFGDHNIVINMATSPLKGIDRVLFSDINGVKQVNYPNGLTFTEIACPSGVVPSNDQGRKAAAEQ